MVDFSQQQLSAQGQRVQLGLIMLLVLSVWLGVKQAAAGSGLMPVLMYVLSTASLSLCFMPSLQSIQDSLRQHWGLVSVFLAMLVQCWWSIDHRHWFGVLVLAGFLVLSLPRATLFALITGLLFIFANVWLHSWRIVIDAMVPVILMVAGIYILQLHLARTSQSLGHSLSRDSLTGCGNLQCLQKEMTRQAELSRRYQVPATALVIRIESWQTVVNEIGARHANSWLKEIVEVWLSRLRTTDILCRYRDTEFVLLLPNTNADNARKLADDLVRASASYEFRRGINPEIHSYLREFDPQEGVDQWMNRLEERAN